MHNNRPLRTTHTPSSGKDEKEKRKKKSCVTNKPTQPTARLGVDNKRNQQKHKTKMIQANHAGKHFHAFTLPTCSATLTAALLSRVRSLV